MNQAKIEKNLIINKCQKRGNRGEGEKSGNLLTSFMDNPFLVSTWLFAETKTNG